MLLTAIFCPSHVSLHSGFEGDQAKTEKTRRRLTAVQARVMAGNLKASQPSSAETGWETKWRRERPGSCIRESLRTTE